MWVIYRYYVQADDQWQHFFFQFLRTTQQVLHFLDNWERDYKFLSSTYILPKGRSSREERGNAFYRKMAWLYRVLNDLQFHEKWAFFNEYHFFFFFAYDRFLKQVFWKWASWFCSSVLFQNEKMTFRNMILICFIFGHFRHSSN